MNMIQTRDDLTKYGGYETTREMTAFASFDEVIEITFHRFENEVEFF
jgi:hypothetical protein